MQSRVSHGNFPQSDGRNVMLRVLRHAVIEDAKLRRAAERGMHACPRPWSQLCLNLAASGRLEADSLGNPGRDLLACSSLEEFWYFPLLFRRGGRGL